ncbi:hypothetical protein ACMA1D_00805 [Streptomyces sp. 796.1]|uniref:hypothetical protein n=1 Tax=Streptomyces sp. 796.1 TaxID=3163029 RepID=UPI0039C94D88
MHEPDDPLRTLFQQAAAAGRARARIAPAAQVTACGRRAHRRRVAGLAVLACLVVGAGTAASAALLPTTGSPAAPATSPPSPGPAPAPTASPPPTSPPATHDVPHRPTQGATDGVRGGEPGTEPPGRGTDGATEAGGPPHTTDASGTTAPAGISTETYAPAGRATDAPS